MKFNLRKQGNRKKSNNSSNMENVQSMDERTNPSIKRQIIDNDEKANFLNSVSFMNNVDEKESTKAQRKAQKLISNRNWKLQRLETSWQTADPNPRHSLYYQAQISELNTEFSLFCSLMSKPLPVTFRVCMSRYPLHAQSLAATLHRAHLGTSDLIRRILKESPPVPVPCPSQLLFPVNWCDGAWQLLWDSSSLTTEHHLQPLHQLIRREETLGHVVRQELVSMVPVLFLEVLPGHTVLDMCAAPGSKTDQILNQMSRSVSSSLSSSSSSAGSPRGMVMANDADPRRICTLQKRYARCRSSALILTCCKAQHLHQHLEPSFRFDRILCDVPCSGDGTFRKQPHLWRLFRPRVALELHSLQLSIARSALRLLRPGGRLVYSTCSLNPVENEAVVAGLLEEAGESLHLVDVSSGDMARTADNPCSRGLRYRCGLQTWRWDPEVFVLGESSAERRESLKMLPPLPPTLKPPKEGSRIWSLLTRCVRLYPQDQDTGGFFVAVLQLQDEEEKQVLSSSSSSSSPVDPVGGGSDVARRRRAREDMSPPSGHGTAVKRRKSKQKLNAQNDSVDRHEGVGKDVETYTPVDEHTRDALYDQLGVTVESAVRDSGQGQGQGQDSASLMISVSGPSSSQDSLLSQNQRVVKVSSSVYKLLQSQCASAIVVQAGVIVAEEQKIEGSQSQSQSQSGAQEWVLNPDSDGEILEMINSRHILRFNVHDFHTLLHSILRASYAGARAPEGGICVQCEEEKQGGALWSLVRDACHENKYIVVQLDKHQDKETSESMETIGGIGKHRMSKSERKRAKRMKSNMSETSARPCSSSAPVEPVVAFKSLSNEILHICMCRNDSDKSVVVQTPRDRLFSMTEAVDKLLDTMKRDITST